MLPPCAQLTIIVRLVRSCDTAYFLKQCSKKKTPTPPQQKQSQNIHKKFPRSLDPISSGLSYIFKPSTVLLKSRKKFLFSPLSIYNHNLH